MNILYISNKPIYPKIDGGCVAMHNFLSCLIATDNHIKHLSISTHKHLFNYNNYPTEIAKKVNPEGVFIDTRIKPQKAFLNLFHNNSYNIKRFYSKEAEKTIVKLLTKVKYDIIILESIFLSDYIKTIRKFPTIKILLRSHNVEFKIWEKLGQHETIFIKKIYLNKLANDLKRNELKSLSKVDLILTISDDDKNTFINLGLKTPIETIPVAVNQSVAIKDYENDNYFHIGAMNWKPNIEAVKYLTSIVFPKIQKIKNDVNLTLAGSFMDNLILENETEKIVNKGFVDNVESFIAQEGILLAPILSGSGVRIKILESMAIGTPVVTTILGAEGLNVTSGEEIYIAKNEAEFIQYSLNLSNSKTLREKMGKNAKTYINKQHDKNLIIKKLNGIINSIS